MTSSTSCKKSLMDMLQSLRTSEASPQALNSSSILGTPPLHPLASPFSSAFSDDGKSNTGSFLEGDIDDDDDNSDTESGVLLSSNGDAPQSLQAPQELSLASSPSSSTARAMFLQNLQNSERKIILQRPHGITPKSFSTSSPVRIPTTAVTSSVHHEMPFNSMENARKPANPSMIDFRRKSPLRRVANSITSSPLLPRSDGNPASRSTPNTKRAIVTTQSNMFKKWSSEKDRNLDLRLALIKAFPEEQLSLSRVIQDCEYNPYKYVHIVVDFSNIYIGYQTAFAKRMNKTKETLSKEEKLMSREFDLETLFSILHRARVVKDKALSGTSADFDNPDSFFKEAEVKYGYKCEILGRATVKKGEVGRKEQGVDTFLISVATEIILDNRDHPSTLVLATGDGAYSNSYYQSFADTAKRAMEQGFDCEIVSFSDSLSNQYLRLKTEFPDQMRIIKLNPFLDYFRPVKKNEE
jgi:hypothetical protein